MRINGGSSGGDDDEASKNRRPFKLLEVALRLCVIPFALASLWQMATNKQADDTYGNVQFANISGFKYLVCINAIAAAYSLASVFLTSFKPFTHCDWLLLILDQVVAYMLVTSGSAVAEVLYLSQEGDREVSWGEVCSYFGKFCSKATLSLALHGVALFCFMALALISACRVFSKCDAPAAVASSNSKQVEEQSKN